MQYHFLTRSFEITIVLQSFYNILYMIPNWSNIYLIKLGRIFWVKTFYASKFFKVKMIEIQFNNAWISPHFPQNKYFVNAGDIVDCHLKGQKWWSPNRTGIYFLFSWWYEIQSQPWITFHFIIVCMVKFMTFKSKHILNIRLHIEKLSHLYRGFETVRQASEN